MPSLLSHTLFEVQGNNIFHLQIHPILLIITTVARYQVSGEGGFMSLHGIFSRISDIKYSIATAIANRNMIALDKELHEYLEETKDIEVTPDDYKEVSKLLSEHNIN